MVETYKPNYIATVGLQSSNAKLDSNVGNLNPTLNPVSKLDDLMLNPRLSEYTSHSATKYSNDLLLGLKSQVSIS